MRRYLVSFLLLTLNVTAVALDCSNPDDFLLIQLDDGKTMDSATVEGVQSRHLPSYESAPSSHAVSLFNITGDTSLCVLSSLKPSIILWLTSWVDCYVVTTKGTVPADFSIVFKNSSIPVDYSFRDVSGEIVTVTHV